MRCSDIILPIRYAYLLKVPIIEQPRYHIQIHIHISWLDVTTFKVMFFSSCLNHTYVSVVSPLFFTYSANKTLISIPSIPCILDVTDTDANQAQKVQWQTTIQ